MSKWNLRVGGLVSLSLGVAWTPAAAVLGYPTWFYAVCGAAVGFGAVLLASLFGGDALRLPDDRLPENQKVPDSGNA